jgi:hypothetical protein
MSQPVLAPTLSASRPDANWAWPAMTRSRALFAGVVLLGSLAGFGAQADWAGAPEGERDVVEAAPAAAGPTPVKARCPGCGTVRSIRHQAAAGELPANYELTVRLDDGSTHISNGPDGSVWRAGDRILLIGGLPGG